MYLPFVLLSALSHVSWLKSSILCVANHSCIQVAFCPNNHLPVVALNIPYTGKFWQGKIGEIELSAKFSCTDILKLYSAYALTIAYSPKFSSQIAFTCMVCQNFPLSNIPVYRSNQIVQPVAINYKYFCCSGKIFYH